jgi:hypothetical protein
LASSKIQRTLLANVYCDAISAGGGGGGGPLPGAYSASTAVLDVGADQLMHIQATGFQQ